jgi:DnaK suppressor protein
MFFIWGKGMTKEDLKQLKKELLKRKESLLSLTRSSLISLQDFDKTPADEIDFAVQEVSQFMNFALHTKDRVKLLQIEKALARIESGEYGYCEHCGEKINVNRLKAQPYSIYCIECKEDIELGNISFA